MDVQFDLIIRGGTVVDGTGGPVFIADVGVVGDTIAAVGELAGAGRVEVDATGRLVTPGFVDIHTHYDGQAIWSGRLDPSSSHGVTTVVIGNCGVGFAPCRAQDRDRLVKLMEGIEDIPGVVMTEGLDWNWESYPDFLDAVERRPHDINIASFLPHSALRVYVMGARAAAGEVATDADIASMAALTREAMAAGAIGFASSRTIFHRSSEGDMVPTLDAGEAELAAIAGAMQAVGDGILQFAVDYKNGESVDEEFALMRRVAQGADRLLMLPTVQVHGSPQSWRRIVALIEQANAAGVRVKGQALPRAIGMLFGLELSMHPFCLTPAYRAIAHLPLAERLARMRDPAVRARILGERPLDPPVPLLGGVRRFEGMFEMGEVLDYEPPLDTTIANRAAQAGVAPDALAYDLLVRGDGGTTLFLPFVNYADGDLDAVFTMLRHKDFVPGLGDGGAHCGVICDASYSTFMLTHWTRDRTRGGRLTVPAAVKALAHDTAASVGLHDRGIVAAGYRADLNVIDYAGLSIHQPKISFDLPAGGRRLTQAASGYVASVVNGRVVYRDGVPTGELPGVLVRGQQAAPSG